MKIWLADDESVDLLEASAEMAIAAEEARARRVDPDGIISASHRMSVIKLTEAMRQVRAPHLKEWEDFTDAEKAEFFEALDLFQAQTDAQLRSIAFRKLRNSTFCRPPIAEEIQFRGRRLSESSQRRKNAKAPARVET